MFKQLVAPLFFALAASAAFTIDTPAINQCKDVSFKISGNQGKVRLQVLPSVNPCEHDPLADSGEFDLAADGTYTWSNLNVAAGTSVVVVADDDSDNEAWTATIVVGGNASDCSGASGSTTATRTSAPTSNSSNTRSNARTSATEAPANAANSDANSGAASFGASMGVGAVALISAFAMLF